MFATQGIKLVFIGDYMILDDLYKIILDRKKKMPDNSYVTSLFREGSDKIIQKVGEESTEVIIAAKNKDRKRIISEVADLIFHLLIMLSLFKITPLDIFKELKKRKTSLLPNLGYFVNRKK